MAEMQLGEHETFLYLGNRRLRVDGWSRQVARFLLDLESFLLQDREESSRLLDLLETREDFVRIIEKPPLVGLLLAMQQGGPTAQRLAIWLLGKCEAREVTPQIFALRFSPDPQLRRAVARALRRLAAWSDLAWLEKNDSDPSVRRLAAILAKPPRKFSDRLERFTGASTKSVLTSPRFESPMPVVWDADPFNGKPPKPAWLIRRILERIRQAVTMFSNAEN